MLVSLIFEREYLEQNGRENWKKTLKDALVKHMDGVFNSIYIVESISFIQYRVIDRSAVTNRKHET